MDAERRDERSEALKEWRSQWSVLAGEEWWMEGGGREEEEVKVERTRDEEINDIADKPAIFSDQEIN